MTEDQPLGIETAAGEDAPLVPGVAPLTAFPPEPADPGHLLPADAWAQIKRDAQARRAQLEQDGPPFRTGLGLSLAGAVVAPSHGAARGRPTFGVFHTMETPLEPGYAASLARYAAGGPGVSWHYGVDPAETWGVLPDTVVAWHVGTANTRSLGLEQAGRAAMTRDQWLTDTGMAQHRRSADVVRHARDEYGIGIYLMSDQQLRDAHAGKIVGGWATHDQCRRVIGGTTHTDPGGGWPADVVLQLAAGQVPAPPPPTPQPQPAGIPRPPVLRWTLPAGHWLGNVAGPARQHGGDLRWDTRETHDLVANVQAWLIYRGAAGPDHDWRARTWDDGIWQGPTDAAMTAWHRTSYPHQQFPAQCWPDDYRRLTA